MISTMIAVCVVSLRVGHTTFAVSARTWRMNSPGLVLCHVPASCLASFKRVAASAPTGGVESDIGSDFGID